MNTRHQELFLGLTGQAFVFDVPDGRPDASPAPTASVYAADAADDDDAETATTGTVAIDSVNTLLTEDATAGDNIVELASASAVARGRRYLLGAEWVEVIKLENLTATLRRPLLNSYEGGVATFVGTRLSIAVNPTWAADDQNISDSCEPGFPGYRVRWEYSLDGRRLPAVTFADLLRYPSQNLITALDVDDRFPGFIDRLPPDHRDDQGAAIIREAYEAVRFDALGDAQALRRVRDTQVLGELVVNRAPVIAIQYQILAGAQNMLDALKVARDAYDVRYNQLLRQPKVAVDSTGDGAAQPARRLPLWVR